MNETELYATVLLIHHFLTMEWNSFTVSETTSFNDSFCEENVLGFAICPYHNTISHSCDPNVGDFVRRREHVLFALRPIKRGEEVRPTKLSRTFLLRMNTNDNLFSLNNRYFFRTVFHFRRIPFQNAPRNCQRTDSFAVARHAQTSGPY